MKETKFYKGYVKLIETLKPMTAKQRVEHIWEYYKEYMFIALMVILLLIAVITSILNSRTEVLFSGALVNVNVTNAGWEYIDGDFFEHIGGVEGKQEVRITSSFFEDMYTSAEKFDINYNVVMSVVSMVSAKSLDYMLMDQNAMEIYLTQDVMMDLSDFFTEEEINAFGDRLIYLELEDEDGESISRSPVALDVTDMPFVQDCLDVKTNCYFALAANTPHLDTCRDFWEYLLAWE